MRTGLKRVAPAALLVALLLGAFASGKVAYQWVQYRHRAQSLALYGSVLRIAGRSPLALSSADLSKQSDLRPLDTFSNVERRLRANYFEKIENNAILAYGTADNMVDSLGDPYSRFLEPAQWRAYNERLEGTYTGIGAALAVRKEVFSEKERTGEEMPAPDDDPSARPAFDDPVDSNCVERAADGSATARFDVFVLATAPGGPAEKAGLLPGDVIRKVNGKLIYTKNLDTLEQMLLTARTGSVKLGVARKGAKKILDMTVPFAVTRVQPVTTRVHEGVGILTLHSLGPGTADAVRARIREMLATRVSGLVLDLRAIGVGDWDEARAVASSFVTSGTLAEYKERGGKMTKVTAESGRFLGNLPPMAVLVGSYTAGPAEFLAGALKANRAGYLVGSSTMGMASRQELLQMPGNSALLLTTSLFFLPGSPAPELVEGKGIVPDIVVPDKAGAGDATLQRAIVWIKDGAA